MGAGGPKDSGSNFKVFFKDKPQELSANEELIKENNLLRMNIEEMKRKFENLQLEKLVMEERQKLVKRKLIVLLLYRHQKSLIFFIKVSLRKIVKIN